MTHYDAFLSYSHGDSALADRLSRRIRSYRPPRAAHLARRKLDVFRDVERLTASSNLSEALEERIGSSEHLVLLASPDAAGSRYVDSEVAAFLRRKEPSNLLVVLCRGELAEGTPPSLKESAGEPLFIDLRGAGRKRFRLETLRLIAALLGVDYSELRRQDDERRRRRRNSVIAAGLLTLLLLASGYLISTTPAELWQRQPQPERPANLDPLLPAQEFAVNRKDPSVVVWFARNARHARDLAKAKTTWKPDADFGDLQDRAARRLSRLAGIGVAAEPVAVVNLDAVEGGKIVASGELRLYGFRENGRPRLARSFSFAGKTKSGRRRLVLPLTALDESVDPFDLEPFAASLEQAGFDSFGLDLRGQVDDRTAEGAVGPPREVRFAREDESDIAREQLDATASEEYAVLTSSPAWQPKLEQELEDAGGLDFWQSLVRRPEWATYNAPQAQGPITLSAAETPEIYRVAKERGLEEPLARALAGEIRRGAIHDVWQVSRRSETRRFTMAVVISHSDFEEDVKDFPPIHFYQAGADRPWVRTQLPLESSTRIVDVFPLDAAGTRVLIATDREGFLRTTDGGKTWHDATFGEPALRNGAIVRTVTVGSAVHALAVLRTEPGDDSNPLFRLKRRNWIERWRAGLAALLKE